MLLFEAEYIHYGLLLGMCSTHTGGKASCAHSPHVHVMCSRSHSRCPHKSNNPYPGGAPSPASQASPAPLAPSASPASPFTCISRASCVSRVCRVSRVSCPRVCCPAHNAPSLAHPITHNAPSLDPQCPHTFTPWPTRSHTHTDPGPPDHTHTHTLAHSITHTQRSQPGSVDHTLTSRTPR